MLLNALFFLMQASLPNGPLTPVSAPGSAPVSAPVSPPPPVASVALSPTAAGRALAAQNCQSCHAIGRRGVSPNPAAPRFRYLSRKYPIDNLSESFAEGVLIGHSVMPEFEFAPEKVEALMAYIKSVQVPRRPTRKK